MSRVLDIDDIYRIPIVWDAQISPDGNLVAYVVTVADREEDRHRSTVWVVPTAGGPPRQLTVGDDDLSPRWSPDGRWLAFLRAEAGGPQLWVLPADGGEARALSHAPGGASSPVWSWDGARIAFLALVEPDDSGDEAPSPASERLAGRPVVERRIEMKLDGLGYLRGRRRHLFIVDVTDGALTRVTRGDFFVDDPAWSPDSREIAFVSALHDERDLDGVRQIFVIPATGGEPRAITEFEGAAAAPLYTRDGATIVFAGKARIAVGHVGLFAVPASGGAPKRMLSVFDRSVLLGAPRFPGARPMLIDDGATVAFCARDGGYTHIYGVPLTGGEPAKLSGSAGVVFSGMSYSAAGRVFASVRGDADSPGEVAVIPLAGEARVLTSHVARALPDVRGIPAVPRQFTGPDGTEVHGWLIQGVRDGPGPLLVDLHGGPHNSWAPVYDPLFLHHQTLAASGWTILLLDPRGSDGYGEAFFCGAAGAWGEADSGDVLSAVDSLIEAGIADPQRLAVAGYSYGGFLTCWLTAHTTRFAAAAAGGCVSDLVSMFGTSDAAYLFDGVELDAHPGHNAARLRELSPMTHVERVVTPTLLLHGEDDANCPVGQAEQWFAALRARRVPTRLVRYPGGDHLFPIFGPPSHRADFCRQIVDWVRCHTGEAIPEASG